MLNDKMISVVHQLASGEKNLVEIAAENGICRKTLYTWRQNPEFKKLLQEMETESIDEAKQILKLNASKAARNLVKAMDSKNAKVSMDSCRDVLDRSGLSVALQIKAVPPDEAPKKLDVSEVKKLIEQRKLKD